MSQFWFATGSPLSAPRLAGPWDLCPSTSRRLIQEDMFSLGTHRCMQMQTAIVMGILFVALQTNVGAMFFNRPWCPGSSLPGTRVHIPAGGPRCASGNTRGLLGSTASSRRSREQKQIYVTRLARETISFVSKKTHGKDECLQAVQVQHSQFRMFGTFMLNNVNAGGSARAPA